MNQPKDVCAVLEAVRAGSNPLEYFRHMSLHDKKAFLALLSHDLVVNVVPLNKQFAGRELAWTFDGPCVQLTLT